MLLGANDIRGDVAELYGYVNRALPDAELDAFVDELAMRIASFDKRAIAETKRLVNIASLPSDAEIAPEWNAFIDSLGRPASQTRIKALMERAIERGVLLAPGSSCGDAHATCARLCFTSVPIPRVAEGIARLRAAMDDLST